MAEARRILMTSLRADPAHPPLAFATDWVEEIARRAEHVTLITNWLGDWTPPANVTVRSLGGEANAPRPLRLWRLLAWSWQAFTRDRRQLHFGHMTPEFATYLAPICRLLNRPNVFWYAHGKVSPPIRRALAAADLAVTSSAAGLQIDSPKRRILSQGVSTARFGAVRDTARPDGPVIFLNVGRLAPLKRTELAVEAFALLPAEARERARLRIVGDILLPEHAPYEASLKARVAELGLGDRVTVEPSVPFRDLPALYASAHAFVSASPFHSIDKASLEALAAGLPAVVTNPAYVAALGDDFAPWCVESGEPAEIAAAMARLIAMSPGERHATALRFAEAVEARHSLTALADKLFEVFDEALERRR